MVVLGTGAVGVAADVVQERQWKEKLAKEVGQRLALARETELEKGSVVAVRVAGRDAVVRVAVLAQAALGQR